MNYLKYFLLFYAFMRPTKERWQEQGEQMGNDMQQKSSISLKPGVKTSRPPCTLTFYYFDSVSLCSRYDP